MFDLLPESQSRAVVPRWGLVVALTLHAGVFGGLLLLPSSKARAEVPIISTIAWPQPEPVIARPSSPPTLPIVHQLTTIVPLPGPILNVPPVPTPTVGEPGPIVLTEPLGPAESGADPVSAELLQDPPVLLTAPVPEYPRRLREAGIQGQVIVEAVVDTLGRVESGSLRVVRADQVDFEASAVASIRAALFRPARVLGKPVRVLVRVPVSFRLR
ncbi:MAG TPA: TonB family protein [bacterium]|nr:TonB family protein [bacterium]